MEPITIEEFVEAEKGRNQKRGEYVKELMEFMESGADAAVLKTIATKQPLQGYRQAIIREGLPVTVISRGKKVYAFCHEKTDEPFTPWQHRLAFDVCGGEYPLPEDICETADWLVSTLKDSERQVIEMRYKDGLTLQKCGELLGVTRERIRQIQNKALRRLRTPKCCQRLRVGISEYKRAEQEYIKAKEEIWQKEINKIKDSLQSGNERDIEDLDLSVRAFNALKLNGINTIETLVDKLEYLGEADFEGWLLSIHNLGRKSAEEITRKIMNFGRKG